MAVNQKIKNIFIKLIFFGLFFLTGLGFLKGIFISLDIDESYALAQSYRMAIGERLLLEMWEPHQLSAFVGALFIKIYLLLGTTDYLVIFLRIIGMLLHLGMGIWLYHAVQKDFGKRNTLLVLLLHLNFFPKWLQTPEFELMHYWFMLAIFILLYGYYKNEGKAWRPFVAGACLVGMMMCYPTMILLYPFYLLGMYRIEKKNALKSILWFTAGAGVSGSGFLLYLLSYQTPSELIRNIQFILLDESHTTYTMSEKWMMYGEQALELLQVYGEQMGIAILIVVLFGVGMLIVPKFRTECEKIRLGKKVEYAIVFLLVVTSILLQKEQVLGCLLEDKNQFYGQIRYVAALLPGLFLGIRYGKKLGILLWLAVVPSVLSLPATLLVTNMDVNVACSKVVLGVWASMLMLVLYLKEEIPEAGIMTMGKKILPYIWGVSMLLSFFICRLLLIRVTGCLPVTIAAPLERMNDGPEKGIYILEEQARIWNDNYSNLETLIDAEDNLLYLGEETLIYPAVGCGLSTPSTQGTTVFNEMFLRYYEEHPGKKPNVVVIDKTLATNPVYALYSDISVIEEWLAAEYPNPRVVETSYMKILFLDE